jgi:hypothetical protein
LTQTERHQDRSASSNSNSEALVHWANQIDAEWVPKGKADDTPVFNHWNSQKVPSAKSREGLSIVKGTLFLLLRDLCLYL